VSYCNFINYCDDSCSVILENRGQKMKNLVNNIINELEDVGIELLVDNGNEYDYHQNYRPANTSDIRDAINKAIEKSMEEKDENT
jgi:hypothetical protein